MGAKEGLSSIIINLLKPTGKTISQNRLQRVVEIFMVLTCWFVATVNPNILKMIETLGGPVIAILLFIMPMYAIAKIPAMQKYRTQVVSNVFTTIMGIIAISAIVYGLL